jgi:RHS repeat-associated protein
LGHYPYGESWYNSTGDKLLFTTYERDAESGNDYAMARYYVNRLGRFSSLDLMAGSTSDPQSLNRYDYVRNDAINSVDPAGLDTRLASITGSFNDDTGSGGLAAALGDFLSSLVTLPTETVTVTGTPDTVAVTDSFMFALFHVHPNTGSWQPSTPQNNYEGNGLGDTGVADKFNLQMYVVSRAGLGLYDPTTKGPSTLVRPGMSWTKPCP